MTGYSGTAVGSSQGCSAEYQRHSFRPFGAGVPFDGIVADHNAAGCAAACCFKDLNFDMDCLPQCLVIWLYTEVNEVDGKRCAINSFLWQQMGVVSSASI